MERPECAEQPIMKRRSFMKASAAAIASMALFSETGCSNNLKETEEANGEYLSDYATQLAKAEQEGEWIPVACWSGGCGGRCAQKALVYDGVVVRQKTDDHYADEKNGHFQNRACPRGRARRQEVFGEGRLKYPMKRKSWQPGGGSNSQGDLRGIDEWERISWDEATTLIASEFERIYGTYGGKAAYFSGRAGSEFSNLMCAMGGYIPWTSAESYGSWQLSTIKMGTRCVNYNSDSETTNSRFDYVNADIIVLQGCNPAWANGGSPMYHFQLAKEAGAEFIFIGPSYNLSANALDATWIPVRPGTDTAFLLAVAYEMIQNDYLDQDFIDKYSVGFDMDHLPADATVQECFKDYVLGKYDGFPKTPEWATEYCGTPVEQIRWYAEKIRKENNVMLMHSYAGSRQCDTENLPQLFLTIGIMGGHIGRSGNCTGGLYHYDCANAGPRLVNFGSNIHGSYIPNPIIDESIQGPIDWKAMLEKKYIFNGSLGYGINSMSAPEEREIDIKLIVMNYCNFLQNHPDTNSGIKAWRQVEFVLAMDIWFSMSCQYADIILPASTPWEEYTPNANIGSWANRETALFYRPVTKEPLFECKNNQDAAKLIAEKIPTLNAEELFPYSYKQQWFDQMLGATVMTAGKPVPTPDIGGEYNATTDANSNTATDQVWQPLITITQEDLDTWGVEGEPVEGIIALDEILRDGTYQVEHKPGDDFTYIGYQDFIEDPENNPRGSNSGKFEIYCQDKADQVNISSYLTDESLKPYPTMLVGSEGTYYSSFTDWDSKTKGSYPLQAYTPHYLRRSHTTMDNNPWLRESFENPVFMNAADAAERNIATGDTVLIESPYGKILRHASVLETIMPGVVALPHGVRCDFDEESGIDYGGSENTLTGPIQSKYLSAISPYNSLLVEISKWDGNPIPRDCEKQFIVEFSE